jgi:pyruvate,water dikinase
MTAENSKSYKDNPFGAWLLCESDFKNAEWWITYDPIHEPEPLTPLAGCLWAELHQYGYCSASEKVYYPFSHGVLCRLNLDGYMALSAPLRTSEREENERMNKFYELLDKFKYDFTSLWGDFKHKGQVGLFLRKIMQNYSEIGAFNLEKWCFNLDFLDKLNNLYNCDLLDLFFKFFDILKSHWTIHFAIMYPSFYLYNKFEKLTEELLGINDQNPIFQRLLQGFENKISECTFRLWSLAQNAKVLGLTSLFESSDLKSIFKILQVKSENWMEMFHEFLLFYGVRSDNPFDLYKETWLENPLKPLSLIKNYVFSDIDLLDKHRRVVGERDKVLQRLLQKITPDKTDEFMNLLRAAQMAYCWNEDHNYWIEQFGFAVMRYIIMEMGRRLHLNGCIKDKSDIFFLNPQELSAMFLPAVSTGRSLHNITEKRKNQWITAINKKPPLIAGEKTILEENPIVSKLFGLPPPTPHKGPDIVGYPGSPGTVVDKALVVYDLSVIYQIKDKAILVVPSLNPAWTFIIPFLKGLVTDFGGTLSHAAIVCREYGIPSVVGTSNATKLIKNGDKIMLDGNKGYVWILGNCEVMPK